MNIPLELIIRIILLETQNAQGKLSAMLCHNFSKAYHAVFMHFCSFKCSPLLRLLAPNLLVGLSAQELQRWRIQESGSVGAWRTQPEANPTKPRTTRNQQVSPWDGGWYVINSTTKDTTFHSDGLCQWATLCLL